MNEYLFCGMLIGALIVYCYWFDGKGIAMIIGAVVGGVSGIALLALGGVVIINALNGEFTIGINKSMPMVLFSAGLAGTVLCGYILKKVRQRFFLLVIN